MFKLENRRVAFQYDECFFSLSEAIKGLVMLMKMILQSAIACISERNDNMPFKVRIPPELQ